MSMIYRTLIAAAALIALPATALAQGAAANYPTRPVTLVSPYLPGASTDKDGRVWVQKLQESLGKPFILDFKPGAASTIGTNFVAKSAPDGHTLVIVTSAFTVIAAAYKDLPYDAIRDFAPVSLTLKRPAMLLAHPSLPVNNLEEYIAWTRAHPTQLNFGTSGQGGIYHMVGAWLQSLIGTKVTFVHYKSTSPMFVDFFAGRVQASPSSLFTGLPYIKAGKLKAITILSAERSDFLPGMKTVAEQGYPDFEYSAWEGIFAPAKTPAAIVNKLSGEFARMMKQPDVIKIFAGDGTRLIGSTPEELGKFIATDIPRWKKLVVENDIKVDETE